MNDNCNKKSYRKLVFAHRRLLPYTLRGVSILTNPECLSSISKRLLPPEKLVSRIYGNVFCRSGKYNLQDKRLKFLVYVLLSDTVSSCFRILGLTKKSSLATFSEAPGKDSGGPLSP